MKKYKVTAKDGSERFFDDYDLALRFAVAWCESGNTSHTIVSRTQDGTWLAEYKIKGGET